MLTITNLNIYYGESHTIRDVSLQLNENEAVAIMGRNGMGKIDIVEIDHRHATNAQRHNRPGWLSHSRPSQLRTRTQRPGFRTTRTDDLSPC